jgi:peptidoglycan/xylan/chitin deacetylase (PgdA/CDA1 family)
MYHAAASIRGRFAHLGVAPDVLLAHLSLLTREGFMLVGITEALRLSAEKPRLRVAAVTFDDAYVDFVDVVLPALQALEARATLYVPTAYVGGNAGWLGAAAPSLPRLLSWEQLRECSKSGNVEIGSHSHTHAQLDTLPRALVTQEVTRSRQLLEDALQVEVKSLSYPHGYHSPAVREAVHAAGYDNACEVGRRLRSPQHRLSISRLAIGPSHHPARLLREARNGGPLLVPTVKRALQPGWRGVRRCRQALKREGMS